MSTRTAAERRLLSSGGPGEAAASRPAAVLRGVLLAEQSVKPHLREHAPRHTLVLRSVWPSTAYRTSPFITIVSGVHCVPQVTAWGKGRLTHSKWCAPVPLSASYKLRVEQGHF